MPHSSVRVQDAARRIAINGPTVIGYFPAVSDKELANDDALGSAFEHLQMALATCDACFGSHGVDVQMVIADKITVVDDGRVQEILPRREPDGIGAFLVSPGRDGRIVHAGRGPSSLVSYVPQAASEYFELPACGSRGGRDAP